MDKVDKASPAVSTTALFITANGGCEHTTNYVEEDPNSNADSVAPSFTKEIKEASSNALE